MAVAGARPAVGRGLRRAPVCPARQPFVGFRLEKPEPQPEALSSVWPRAGQLARFMSEFVSQGFDLKTSLGSGPRAPNC